MRTSPIPSSKREKLVETALALFYREGYHAVGIDRVVAEAGVAKMTLYKHFKSKEELILAALRLRDQQWRHALMKEVESRARDPRGRLLAVFDALQKWFEDSHCQGCMFIHATAEYGDKDHPIHRSAAEHLQLVGDYMTGLARKAGATDPIALVRQLAVLMEGAVVCAKIHNDPTFAHAAKDAAEVLLQQVLLTPQSTRG